MSKNRVNYTNIEILKKCREQINLTLENVEKKVKKIREIEEKKIFPTFKQLDALSKLYLVPRWVFISDQLPKEYRFISTLTFRHLAESNSSEIFKDSKIRSIVTKVEQLRNLIIDLKGNEYPLSSFVPPKVKKQDSPEEIANKVRSWLGMQDNYSFVKWKEALEEKGIFVFTTSTHPDWSYAKVTELRGLAIFYSILPIIIINSSDSHKAQSFTLFHELSHLLLKTTSIDNWTNKDTDTDLEKWCDDISGNILMPLDKINDLNCKTLEDLNKAAKKLKISSYALLVRLFRIKKINQKMYIHLKGQMEEEYKKAILKLKNKKIPFPRNISKEVLKKYGNIYTKTLFQAYFDKEISLHKLRNFFGLKKTKQVVDLQNAYE